MHCVGRFSFYLSVLILMVIGAVPARASKPDPNATVLAALTHLSEQVDTAMKTASAANNTAALEAGRDLMIAISSTQNVYTEEMAKALGGKIPPALKATVSSIGDAADELTAMTKDSIPQATTHAEQITNSLPYVPSEPRLAKFSPRFLVPASESYLVKMKFNGAFDAATKPEFFPTLLIGSHAYKPVASSASEVEYDFPIADVFAPGATSAHPQYATGTLKVPWLFASMMGKKHSKKEDDFKLYVLGLPTGPGTIKFFSKATKLELGTPQRHTSQTYHQCSGKCGPDDVNHLWSENAEPNCTVVTGSSTFDVTKGEGDYKKEFLGDVGNVVSYSVSTTHHGAASATVDFGIDFMEACGKVVPNDVSEEMTLTWGGSKTIKAAAGSWKLTLDQFDGKHVEFTDTTINPLLRVTVDKEKGEVTITAPEATAVVWP